MTSVNLPPVCITNIPVVEGPTPSVQQSIDKLWNEKLAWAESNCKVGCNEVSGCPQSRFFMGVIAMIDGRAGPASQDYYQSAIRHVKPVKPIGPLSQVVKQQILNIVNGQQVNANSAANTSTGWCIDHLEINDLLTLLLIFKQFHSTVYYNPDMNPYLPPYSPPFDSLLAPFNDSVQRHLISLCENINVRDQVLDAMRNEELSSKTLGFESVTSSFRLDCIFAITHRFIMTEKDTIGSCLSDPLTTYPSDPSIFSLVSKKANRLAVVTFAEAIYQCNAYIDQRLGMALDKQRVRGRQYLAYLFDTLCLNEYPPAPTGNSQSLSVRTSTNASVATSTSTTAIRRTHAIDIYNLTAQQQKMRNVSIAVFFQRLLVIDEPLAKMTDEDRIKTVESMSYEDRVRTFERMKDSISLLKVCIKAWEFSDVVTSQRRTTLDSFNSFPAVKMSSDLITIINDYLYLPNGMNPEATGTALAAFEAEESASSHT